jgi:hypothetical protein
MSQAMKKKAVANKTMELIIPTINWAQEDLTGNQSAMSFIQKLRDDGMISMNTILPMLKLDPDTEKRNLEKERGTVFDKNAPSTGPLPQNNLSTGENSESETPPVNPKSENIPPKGKSNPEDFGFPKDKLNKQTSLEEKRNDLKDFFTVSGEWKPQIKEISR